MSEEFLIPTSPFRDEIFRPLFSLEEFVRPPETCTGFLGVSLKRATRNLW